MSDYTNIDKALEIAYALKIEIPQKYAVKVIYNKELQKKLISKWKRKYNKQLKIYSTFCGQYTSEFFLQAGYDMEPILKNKSLWNINTTGQYKNACESVKKNKLIEVTAKQAFYLACIARPVLVLSPKNMKIGQYVYNHAAITWPIFRVYYNENKGPAISQQGYYSLCPGYVSDKASWGKKVWKKEDKKIYYAWQHEMVKYFLPGLK